MMQAVYRKADGRNSLSHIQDGKKHGLHWVWNDGSGMLLSEYPLCNDLYHGIMRHWHFNGRLQSECYYHKGLQKGLERAYHGNGNLMREVLWVNGVKHGVQRTWDLLGRIYSEMSFHQGVMHGRSQFYDANGEQVGPDTYYDRGKSRDRKMAETDNLLGKDAVPTPGTVYGRALADAIASDVKEKMMGVEGELVEEVREIPRPSHYDMALGALAAHKVKRWHSDGLGPEDIRSALIETKNVTDTYKEV